MKKKLLKKINDKKNEISEINEKLRAYGYMEHKMNDYEGNAIESSKIIVLSNEISFLENYVSLILD